MFQEGIKKKWPSENRLSSGTRTAVTPWRRIVGKRQRYNKHKLVTTEKRYGRYVQPAETAQARLQRVHDHDGHVHRDDCERRPRRPATWAVRRRGRRRRLAERHIVRRGRRRRRRVADPVQLHGEAGHGRAVREPDEQRTGAGALSAGVHRGRVRRAVRRRAGVQRAGVLRRVPAVRQEERAQPGPVAPQPVHRQSRVRRHHHVHGVHTVHAVGAHVPPVDVGPDHVQDRAGRPGRQHNRLGVHHNRHRAGQVNFTCYNVVVFTRVVRSYGRFCHHSDGKSSALVTRPEGLRKCRSSAGTVSDDRFL